MQDPLENLSQNQQKLLKEIKRTLESEKLSLWSFKAELNSVMQKLIKIQNTIENIENTYYHMQQEAIDAKHELEFTLELINNTVLVEILESSTPWKIIQDICSGICSMLGLSENSWTKFLKLSKKSDDLKETMKNFTPETVSSESFGFVSGIIKKHGLGLRVKDGKIPEEFASVTKWFLNAHILVSKTLQFDELSQNLAGLNIKHNKAYLEMKEIKETIKDSDDKIYKLLEAIDICEKNIKRSKNYSNCESFELDSLKAELFNCEGVLKKCRGQKELVVEDTPVSMLIDSLFVSQCYSPDPKVIEFKKYSEDSIVELPTQRNLPVSNNTFENTYSETIETKKQIIKTSKKKCCGLILNCKNP